MNQKVLLIIPCYNESARINLTLFSEGKSELSKKGIDVTYLFADDGSTDGTKDLLQRFTSTSGDIVFSAPVNQGKANVIHFAFKAHAQKNSDFDWVGYWDADLATPLVEVANMLGYLGFYNEVVMSVWGSRVSRLGSKIQRKMHRHYLGRIFVTVVSVMLNVKAYDSQCGAKLFRRSVASKALDEEFISRWIFDVEILLRLKGERIVEYPLLTWEDVPGSKVKVFKEMFRVLKDILRIREKYL